MFKKLFSLTGIAAMCLIMAMPAATAQNLNLNQTLPQDPHVTKGQLSNGLTYYIRPNSKPKDKIELRLVVDAGSILENDNQQGLAHFMEHMNFNGLKHFPKNELVHYLQSIGVQFGADLNANTGWDRTYFILPIPTDNPENIKEGFQIVADWAGNALISTKEVNDERHVISEELRMRDKNAGTRMMKQFLPDMLNGSRYAYRLPGGKDSIVLHCNPDRIREFYHDWYRPDLMAVIVVGDITTEKAEKMIKKYFSYLKNPTPERKRNYYTIKPYTQPKAMIVTDKEATNYSFDLLFPAHKRHIEKTLGDYRHSLVRSILTQTLNRKLHELAQQSKPPYVSASSSLTGTFGGITLTDEGFEMDVSPVDNFKTSIDSAIAELLRVEKYGFSKNDINITKKQIMAYFKKTYDERNKTLSSSLVGEYTRNFMRQEPFPGIENEYKYVQEMLPTIKTKEVSKLAAEVLSNNKNFFALITGPKDGDIDLPSESELLKIVKDAFNQEVKKGTEKAAITSLLLTEPTGGTITSKKSDKALGTTTYTLSNGIKVTVKPTDFKDNQIIFKGVKYGGTGQYGVKDKANAKYMTTLIGVMGYGQFTPTALSNFLSGKTVSVSPEMGHASNVMDGSSSVEDFKTLLKLNYLKMNHPRMDKNLLQGFKTKMETQLKFLKSNPQVAFIDTLLKALYGNSPLAPIQIPSEKVINSIDPGRVMEMYKNQFGDATGFHFFIVGNVNKVKDFKSLIEKYLGGLPTNPDSKPMYQDNGLRKVAGHHTFKFHKGQDQKSLVLRFYYGDVKYSDEFALRANLLSQMMSMEIIDTIREKMAVIYSGGSRAGVSKVPYAHYTLSLQMPAGPENINTILTELDKEMKGFETIGQPKGSGYLEKAKKQTLEKHKDNIKKNGYWAGKLEDIMVWGKSKKFFLNYNKEIKAVTNKQIMKTAKEMLNNNEFTAVSYPEVVKSDTK